MGEMMGVGFGRGFRQAGRRQAVQPQPQPRPVQPPAPAPLSADQLQLSKKPAPTQLRLEADKLAAQAVGRGATGWSCAAVCADKVDANDQRPALCEAAAKAVAANGEAEAAALAKLTPDQQAAYERVACQVSADPMAHQALQTLLTEGKLTGGTPSAEGRDLLGELDRMAEAPKAAGVDGDKLLQGFVREAAHPTSVNQKNRGTCVAATMHVKGLMEQPAEMARLVTGVASPEGTVKTAGGATLTRAEGTAAPDDTGRSESARLLHPALMNLGGQGYSNQTDKFANGGYGVPTAGATAIASQVFNRPVVSTEGRAQLSFKALAASANAGNSVPVATWIGNSGHEELVTGVSAAGVHVVNTQNGTEETMPQATFLARWRSATYVK